MNKKIKLFCLPYAGGSVTTYNNWQSILTNNIELCPIELAGRGSRITDDLYNDLNEAIDDIYNIIKNDILEFDYAIFGHSMGASLAYELLKKIISLDQKLPMYMFFSGRKPPNIPRKGKSYNSMDTQEFQEAVLTLGGTPPEVFYNDELKEIFLPLLRKDFSISETFINRQRIEPLAVNFSILVGKEEAVSASEANQWKLHTSKKCSIHYIDGGHFFLLDHPHEVVKVINNKIALI